MRKVISLWGALLLAAPLFSGSHGLTDPQITSDSVEWFSLAETKKEVAASLGQPSVVAEFGNDFQSWQYQIGQSDSHDFSHFLVFRKSDGTLISVTRNYEPERPVDALFPEAQTATYYYPSKTQAQYSLRLRHLPGQRVLMAMGVSKAGQRTGQLVLMREGELRHFYPWLFTQLNTKAQ